MRSNSGRCNKKSLLIWISCLFNIFVLLTGNRLESKMRKFLKVSIVKLKLHKLKSLFFSVVHGARSFVVAFQFSVSRKAFFVMLCLWHEKGSSYSVRLYMLSPHLLSKSQFLFIVRHKPWHFYYANIIRWRTRVTTYPGLDSRSENEAIARCAPLNLSSN